MDKWFIIQSLIRSVLAGTRSKLEAQQQLEVSRRTLNRYCRRAIDHGLGSLKDHRHSNYTRLTSQQRYFIRQAKLAGPWRSARHIRDQFGLPVNQRTVRNAIADLMHANVERLKPLQRFVAAHPNDLWQTDIMGRVVFPSLGVAYLIAELDDCSRFVLSSTWYRKQNKLNVFSVFYAGLAHWGKPKRSLQDRGSQYKATGPRGEADYAAYCRLLGIELTFASKAQTKGKIERFWRFVQRDFVREHREVTSFEELNERWNRWVAWYNFTFKRDVLGGRTAWEVYQGAPTIHLTRQELIEKLTVEVRRKVSRESTISLGGQPYRVPPGYIGSRIWVKLLGNKLYFESMGEIFWKQRLKV